MEHGATDVVSHRVKKGFRNPVERYRTVLYIAKKNRTSSSTFRTTISRAATSEASIAERLNGSCQVGTVHETDSVIRIQGDMDGEDIIAALEIQSVD